MLDDGLHLAGVVTFPDGVPAAGASVRVRPDLGENVAGSPVDPRDYIGAESEVDAHDDGSFRIAGLGPGPWVLESQLRIEEGSEAFPRRALGRWTVSHRGVRATADELVLALEAPVGVHGTVVDAEGAPVPAFTIRGSRAGSQWYMPPSEERSKTFEAQDGAFSFPDLRSGDWTFVAEAEGRAPSEEIELALPSEEELAFVLHRPVLIAGTVVDPDGAPVPGAEVAKELEGTEVFEAMQGRGDWPVATTDEAGGFVLEGLAPGAGSVVAKRDGFASSEAVAYELDEGEQSTGLVLRLRNGGAISGEVYGPDGDRAAGCVVILQMPTMEERRFLNTGADGTFDERGLTPGAWQVQAFPGIDALQGDDGGTVDQGTLLAALKMKTVQLADEAAEHVVLGAPPAEPVRVHGRVTLAGDPVADAVVSFVPAGGEGMEFLKIDTASSDGAYDIRLDQPGDYLVTIQSAGATLQQNSVEFRRKVPSGEEHELDFEMPLGRITGRVRGPDGDPLAGARVTLNMEGGLVFGTVFGGQYNETATDEDGDYEILFVRPGSYSVAAGGSLLGGLFGDRQGMGRVVTTVDVDEGEWVRGVDFRLEEPGSLEGTVRDAAGKPVSGAAIFVRDEAGRLVELFSLATTNASGRFEYPGLAPGEYTVTARTSSQAAAAPASVRVRSGEASQVTVAVEPGTVLIVTLTDKTGADIPSRVSVVDAQGREMNGMLGLAEIMERYSGGIGSTEQRVGPLPPGKYRVQAVAEDGRSTERPVTLSGQDERKVRLRLR